MESINRDNNVQKTSKLPTEVKALQGKAVLDVDGVFIACKEEGHLKKIQDKVQQLSIHSSEFLTPKILEQSPYKLHITLDNNEYQNHQEAIKEILITHLEEGAINDFKLVDNVKLITNVDAAKNLLNLILEYKNILERNEKPDSDFRDKLFSALDKFSNRRVEKLPYPKHLDELIKTLNNAILSNQRFIDTDQFTIYIPAAFEPNKILNLCKDVDNYLTANNVIAGQSSDVASPLSKHISLRQEFLMGDFNSINESGCVDLDKRINSVTLYETEQDRRVQVVIEQEESDLYLFLLNGLP
jgi:hypothetical protein